MRGDKNPVKANVWGEGIITAFSGYEGRNLWGESLVGHTLADIGFRFILPARFEVLFKSKNMMIPPKDCRVDSAIGDLFEGSFNSGKFLFGPLDYNSFGGIVPPSWEIIIKTESLEKNVTAASGEQSFGSCVLRHRRGDSGEFYLSVQRKNSDKTSAQTVKKNKFKPLFDKRKAFYGGLPAGNSKAASQKCWSILRVNVESGTNWLPCRWTTPDRIPHRSMWLWDSCFHALGWNLIDRTMAEDAVSAVLYTMHENGFIPHADNPVGMHSPVTQPPLLAWTIAKITRRHGDPRLAEWAAPLLEKYLAWNRKNRDRNNNGLMEWEIGGEANCRSGESGMDNSPRFDNAVLLDAVDFSSFMSSEYESMEFICKLTGKSKQAEKYALLKKNMDGKIRKLLFDTEDGFFYDRRFEGKFERVKSIAGFAPLMSGTCTRKQAAALVKHLRDPSEFASPLPVPSAAMNEPSFCSDMWRGPTWLNWSYIVIEGLERYGYNALALEISRKLTEAVRHFYEREGVVFEYYDSLARFSPSKCERKGPTPDGYNIQSKVQPIRDYGWSAAVYLLLEDKYA